MINIAIADDHQMFIDGIKSLFSDHKEINVAVEANNGKQLLSRLLKNKSDVILIDLDMPELDGIETTKELLRRNKNYKIIILSMHNERNHITNSINAGALGYVLKNTSKIELEQAIESVNKGENYYSQKVSQVIFEGLKKNTDKVQLSERELEVLKLITEEFTTKEIAEKLFISVNTVETHRKNLISKLGVRNVVGLVKYAIEKQLF